MNEEVTLSQFSKSRVAVVQGWAAEEYLRAKFPEVIVDAVPDTATGLRKVSFGLVDAFVSELPVATSTMEKEWIANLKVAGEAGYAYELGISVRKDWPELKSILAKALASVTREERETLYKRWVKLNPPPDKSIARLRRIALWSGAGLLTLLAAVMLWHRTLSSRVRARTAEVRAELARRIEIEERFAKAFRYSPDAMFIHLESDGETIEANDGAARMFGGTVGELVGSCAARESWGYVSPEDRLRAEEAIAQNGSVRDFEARFRRKNGEIFMGQVSYERVEIAVRRCVLSITRDVTGLRRMEGFRIHALLPASASAAENCATQPVNPDSRQRL